MRSARRVTGEVPDLPSASSMNRLMLAAKPVRLGIETGQRTALQTRAGPCGRRRTTMKLFVRTAEMRVGLEADGDPDFDGRDYRVR